MSLERETTDKLNPVIANPLLEGLPRDGGGKITWSTLNKNPAKLQTILLDISQEFVSSGGIFSEKNLRKNGLSSLPQAVSKYYPGGFGSLHVALGIAAIKFSDFVTVETSEDGLPRDKRGRIWWSRLAGEPEVVKQALESEATRFIESGNHLNQKNLKVARRSGLGSAIQRYYPGGILTLKDKLKVVMKKEQRPQNFWQPEVIREAAKQFYEETGTLSYHQFPKYKRRYLGYAVMQYSGGMKQLKEDLGIETERKPAGYWILENIEREAWEVYQAEGSLSRATLTAKKLLSLSNAIFRCYPGGMIKLREKLGIRKIRFNDGYDPVSSDEANQDLARLIQPDTDTQVEL